MGDRGTIGTIGVAYDVTDRTLRRLQEDFIASVSHELQTPLTSIRAGLGLLDAAVGETLGPAERELLAASRRNAERLRLEIGQLLAANQLTSRGPAVERAVIDLHRLVDEAVLSLQTLLQEKQQTITVDMPKPLEVEGDRRLLEQVLANLLSNAHRHTSPGTLIAVSGWFVGTDVRFDHLELLARLRALLRRTQPAGAGETLPQPLAVDGLTLVPETRQVRVGERTVALTATEYRLLEELVRHAGRVLPYEYLLTQVWGPEYRNDLPSLRVFIQRVRDKLRDDGDSPRYIQTERGVGFRFVLPAQGSQ